MEPSNRIDHLPVRWLPCVDRDVRRLHHHGDFRPDASHDAVPSCIDVEVVPLVTLAVLQRWRDAVESGDLGRLQQPNPP